MRRLIAKIHQNIWYGIFFAVLSLASPAFLTYEFFGPGVSPELLAVFFKIDLAIAVVFLLDFILGFSFSYERKHYFRENWINIFASVPLSSDLARALRILRLARAVRVIQAALDAKQVWEILRKKRGRA